MGAGKVLGAILVVTTSGAVVLFLLDRVLLAGSVLSVTLLALGALQLDLRRQLRTVARTQRRATEHLESQRRGMERFGSQQATSMEILQRIARTTDEQPDQLATVTASLRGLDVRAQSLERQLEDVGDLIPPLDHAVRELLYTARTIPQDVESQTQLRELVAGGLPLPAPGGWGLDARHLLAVVTLVRRNGPRSVVELGSGASTAWLGQTLSSSGARLLSLDHLEEFAAQTRQIVHEHGLEDTVRVVVAPLRSFTRGQETWKWYDPANLSAAAPIDLVVVDGPPKAVGPLARYPALPVLLPHLADDAWIVLDDARRPDEREVLRRWLQEAPGLGQVRTTSDDLAVLHYQRPTSSTRMEQGR